MTKAVTYDKRPQMKRDARLKAVYSLEKDCFQSGISLHFRAFVVRYGFSSSGFQNVASTRVELIDKKSKTCR